MPADNRPASQKKPKTALPSEIAGELAELAAASGCQLEHLEWKGGVLRLMLDRVEGGITLADCELISKQTSALLDVLDFGRGHYVLEVSSPGLDRPLYRPSDYARFSGRLARVTFLDPETGKKKTVQARLQGLETAEPEEESRVRIVEEKSGEERTLRFAEIQRARLEVEL
jgi:ribosome maturation factor RimP